MISQSDFLLALAVQRSDGFSVNSGCELAPGIFGAILVDPQDSVPTAIYFYDGKEITARDYSQLSRETQLLTAHGQGVVCGIIRGTIVSCAFIDPGLLREKQFIMVDSARELLYRRDNREIDWHFMPQPVEIL